MENINDFILKSRQERIQSIHSNVYGDRLEKSKIPSNLVLDFKKEFGGIVSKLFNLQTLLEHCHRETKSEPHHGALGDAYTDFGDIKDDIIEFTIGDTEKDYGGITIESLPEYEFEMSFLAADLTMQLAVEIQNFAKKYNIPSVENKAQDLHGVGAKLNYKLQMLTSDEGKGIEKLEKGNKTDFPTKERKSLSEKGEAMPDGSFPIRNSQDLKDAIKSTGLAKSPDKAKTWIKKRAKELDLEDLIPEDWKGNK